MGGLGDDGSDVGSDLDEFQSRQIKKLQDEVAWIKENHPMSLKKAYDELNEKLSRYTDKCNISVLMGIEWRIIN